MESASHSSHSERGRVGPGHADAFDALIVGAGVTGLASAWRAAQRGLRTCVLERETPGSGASSVAAGMIAPVGEASWGEEPLVGLNLASAAAWPGFAEELEEASGLPVGYRRCGALHVALDRDETEELRRRHQLQRSLGLEAEWMRPRRCRELEPGLAPACAAGVHAPHESEADPVALVRALAAACERAGVEMVFGAPAVEAVLERGRLAGVVTADGRRFRAANTVLACGWWSGNTPWLPDGTRPPVRPVKGQIVTLRGPVTEPLCERIVATERVYVVPRGDGRVIVGATVEERGADLSVTAGGVHELLREAYRVLPDVAELELVEAKAGLRPGTPDNAPLIGPGAIEGLVLATGHYRHGILLTPATAAAVGALLSGEEPPVALDAFSPGRFATQEVVA